MLSALRGRAIGVGLELKDIDGLDPEKFAVVRDDEDDTHAIVNDDGLPLFTFQEAEALIATIEEHGSYEAWLNDIEAKVTVVETTVDLQCAFTQLQAAIECYIDQAMGEMRDMVRTELRRMAVARATK